MMRRMGEEWNLVRGLVVAGLLAVTAVACDETDPMDPGPTENIVELAAGSADLETLVTAVQAAGLDQDLQGDGPFTVFAPTDGSFESLPSGLVSALLESGNADVLQELLLGHVVSGRVEAADLSDGQTVTTLSGDELTVSIDGGTVSIGGAVVQTADVQATNGVVHIIGGVLTQGLNVVERARITPELSTLVTAVSEGDLVSTLEGAGPFTVFAPTNSAFGALDAAALDRLLADENQALLQKILTYHVIPGAVRSSDLTDDADVATAEGSTVRIDLDNGATVNGVAILTTDIEVENGVIHVIDGVLLEHLDIVDKAILNGFTTLVDAVQTAGLESALRDGSASLTVFAPTEAAFDAITVPSDPQTLESILLYHVIGTEAYASSLSDGQVLTTLQGGDITVQISNGTVMLQGAQNAATVVATDVPASNGVIHAIDAVLLPPSN
ncbi:MAG: fasciclin domain-containing protein [Longimicrobiales bacterium]|nr:fasciclin domain-containing protein [Longimicrobiales bacterium]